MHDQAEDQLAIVLGQRQLMAVCCMLLTVLGLVATLAYVAGRTITAAQLAARETTEVPQPMVVDPPRALETRAETLPLLRSNGMAAVPVAVASPSAPAVVIPATLQQQVVSSGSHNELANSVVVDTKPVAAPQPPALPGEPARGQTFWQVGLVDPATADQLYRRVAELGLPARLASGISPQNRRVLVGPLGNRAEIGRAKELLDGEQMQAFLKIY